jgi:hypothetical protein
LFASVAVAVKLRSDSSLTVLFPMALSTGATLVVLTLIVMVSKSLSAGVPLSVTRMVTENEPDALGVQLNTPDAAPIVAPAGAPASSENVRVLAGISASVAVAVNVSVPPVAADLLPIGARTGATLTSLT